MTRGAAELGPGQARTDTRDSYVLADTAAPTWRTGSGWEPSDAALEELQVLSDYDDGLAADPTQQATRSWWVT